MKRHALAIAVLIFSAVIAGCVPQAVVPVKSDPIDVHVPPECQAACTCDVPAVAITENPYSGVDAAVFEHKKGKACVAQCDTRRKGCADAIARGREAGAIK